MAGIKLVKRSALSSSQGPLPKTPKTELSRSLVWFRSDLRTADNPALHHSTSTSHTTYGLYVVSPAEFEAHNIGPYRVDFLLRNLAALSAKLKKDYNIPLLVRHSNGSRHTRELVSALVKELEIEQVCWNIEYEVDEQNRDRKVKASLTKEGVQVSISMDQCIVEPGTLRAASSGKPYAKFTPFKNSWIATVDADRKAFLTLASEPIANVKLPCEPDEVPDRLKGFELEEKKRQYWPAGEDFAHRRLEKWVAGKVKAYSTSRDLPEREDGTSRMSAYLASGVVSIKNCMVELINANDKRFPIGDSGLGVWAVELIWREFYRHIMVTHPSICKYKAFIPYTENVRWKRSEEQFKAWCEGRTGVPIVDAGMRQLNETGYMHNRLRMITAMFLSKNLLFDWRKGEKYFSTHLVDIDLASNNGGWQWSASTGTDAAPYFRIMNPVSQSKKCDPQGRYIKRWVPELVDLDSKAVHEPSAVLPKAAFARLKYPRPIVDLKASRREAIEAFSEAKELSQ